MARAATHLGHDGARLGGDLRGSGQMTSVDVELGLTALAAMLSPTTLTFAVLALVLGERPGRTGFWFFLGAFAVTLLIGVVAAFVLGNAAAPSSSSSETPPTWVAILDIVFGALLLVFVVRGMRRPRNTKRTADAVEKVSQIASSPAVAVVAAGATLANPGGFLPIAPKDILQLNPSAGEYIVILPRFDGGLVLSALFRHARVVGTQVLVEPVVGAADDHRHVEGAAWQAAQVDRGVRPDERARETGLAVDHDRDVLEHHVPRGARMGDEAPLAQADPARRQVEARAGGDRQHLAAADAAGGRVDGVAAVGRAPVVRAGTGFDRRGGPRHTTADGRGAGAGRADRALAVAVERVRHRSRRTA